jgi:hypothetical protein
LEQPPFSFNITGLLLVDLFPAPVTSSLGPWTNPSEEYMYVLQLVNNLTGNK